MMQIMVNDSVFLVEDIIADLPLLNFLLVLLLNCGFIILTVFLVTVFSTLIRIGEEDGIWSRSVYVLIWMCVT